MQKYSDKATDEVKEAKMPMKEHFGNYMLPIKDALEIFGGKWKIPIITALNFYETCGFKELERIVEGITPKMLSKELKFLEENGLVSRVVKNTRPVTVEYSITEYGKTSSSVMRELYRWGMKHRQRFFKIDTKGGDWGKC